MSRTITIAAAQYPLDAVPTFDAYAQKLERWTREAADRGAQLLIYPEYATMELSAIGGRGTDLHDSISAVSDFEQQVKDLHRDLAKRHRVMIVGGSMPVKSAQGIFNCAHVVSASGKVETFRKMMPTPWERDPWGISGAREPMVFDTGAAKIGVLICYDIEFPLLSRALAEAGAEVIVAPSNTETEWGYWRVRYGCQARALENQIYTVQSPCVGPAPFCAAVENNVGMAGFFGPPDRGLPFDGVIALGKMNQPQWLISTLDLDLTAGLRQQGGVRTFAHWPEQPGAAPLPAPHIIDFT
jgi:predicted amidohydrolase